MDERLHLRLDDGPEIGGPGVVGRQVQATRLDLHYGTRHLLAEEARHIAEVRDFDCRRHSLPRAQIRRGQT